MQHLFQVFAIYFSLFLLTETCGCPATLYTNYAPSKPYIFRDKFGNINGLLPYIVNNLTSFACGICKRTTNAGLSALDFNKNGKNGWAEKRSISDVQRDIDSYVYVSFPILGQQELTYFLGNAFVPVIKHPGVVFFIIKESLDQQVASMIKSVLDIWPIVVINVLMIAVAGIIIWSLVSRALIFFFFAIGHD